MGDKNITPRKGHGLKEPDPLPSKGLALLSLSMGAFGFGGELEHHDLGLALISLAAGIIVACLIMIRARKYR